MTTTSHSYPVYKPSGVPWLSNVPEHWEVVQLGRVGVFSKGSGGTKDDEVPDGIPCIRYGDLYTTHKSFISQTRSYVPPAKARAYTPINRGDVLFPTSGETIEEIGKSAVNLMHTQVLCGGDLIIFRPTIPMEPKFAGYALDCPAAQTQKSLMGRGITIMHIYSGQLKYLWLSLPPLPEQRAIVRYLDYVDRRIRRYVSAKRKLIALLEEEKQAVVNQAVTCGLDPNVRLKPSGVEWLGDVPEHWDVRKLRQYASVLGGVTPSMEVHRFWGGLVPWVTPKDMKQDIIGDSSVKVTDEAIQETSLKLIAPPSVLMVVRGMILARRVPIACTTSPVTINQDMKALRTVTGVNAMFLARSLDSAQEAFKPLIDEAGHGTRRLPTERWRELPIAMPPLSEQSAIVEHLEKATTEIDAAITRTRRQIELLQEYRTRLIADVVTGKLDVREAAAQLLDEADDQDLIGESGTLADGLPGDLYDIDESVEDSVMEEEVTA